LAAAAFIDPPPLVVLRVRHDLQHVNNVRSISVAGDQSKLIVVNVKHNAISDDARFRKIAADIVVIPPIRPSHDVVPSSEMRFRGSAFWLAAIIANPTPRNDSHVRIQIVATPRKW
jgi:hypothetical protein